MIKYVLLMLLVAGSPVFGGVSGSLSGLYTLDSDDFNFVPNGHLAKVSMYGTMVDLPVYGRLTIDTNANPLEDAYISIHKEHSGFGVGLTVGTIDAFHGLYANSGDIVTTSVGIMPQGVYTYDFVNGGFVKSVGTGLDICYISGWGHTKLQISSGDALVNDQDMLEASVFSGKQDYGVDVAANAVSGYSLSVNYRDRAILFLSHSEHDIFLSKTYAWQIPLTIPMYLAMEPEYQIVIDRVGIKLSHGRHWEVVTEAYNLYVKSIIDVPESYGGYISAKGYYGSITYTASYSQAIPQDGSPNIGRSVGIVYNKRKYTVGIEHHVVDQPAWIVEGNVFPDNWTSTVITWSRRF